jgi:CTP:molybdopterin cytidylyltransferase MocA
VRTVAVVLAAGEGRRLGGPKALLPIGATTFLAHVCALLDRPGICAVVAVLGAEADRVRRESQVGAGVVVHVNERWRAGMLTSVWAGLDAAEALEAEGVILHPVDTPFVAPATVEAVVRALADGATIVVPSHAGRRGHPAGFSRRTWPALRAASLDRGARGVLADHPEWISYVRGDPGCLADVDLPSDLGRQGRPG